MRIANPTSQYLVSHMTSLMTKPISTGLVIGLVVFCLLLLFLFLTTCFLLILSTKQKRPESSANNNTGETTPWLIVLGAQVSKYKPTFPSPQLKSRLDTSIDYLEANPQVLVIVTGGQGSNEAEAEAVVMARYLRERGISPDRIYTEDRSTSTIENFLYAQALIRQDPALPDLHTATVATNDYHMYRAMRIARQAGIATVYSLPAPTKSGKIAKAYLRETLALAYHFLSPHK